MRISYSYMKTCLAPFAPAVGGGAAFGTSALREHQEENAQVLSKTPTAPPRRRRPETCDALWATSDPSHAPATTPSFVVHLDALDSPVNPMDELASANPLMFKALNVTRRTLATRPSPCETAELDCNTRACRTHCWATPETWAAGLGLWNPTGRDQRGVRDAGAAPKPSPNQEKARVPQKRPFSPTRRPHEALWGGDAGPCGRPAPSPKPTLEAPCLWIPSEKTRSV